MLIFSYIGALGVAYTSYNVHRCKTVNKYLYKPKDFRNRVAQDYILP